MRLMMLSEILSQLLSKIVSKSLIKILSKIMEKWKVISMYKKVTTQQIRKCMGVSLVHWPVCCLVTFLHLKIDGIDAA